ncbi:MAG: hypothetical protein KAS35_03170 [Candidatus Marinimicrobia bacterium]|jgi:hypothetical protein|nr:hypothetical protein [Candidatus Neomarinimicrobiota bacterium]
MIAYLSGAMENAKNEGSGWRNEISIWLRDHLNHSVIDPVDETAQLVKKTESQNYRNWKTSNPNKFKKFVRKAIDNDLNAVVNTSDYLICLWNNDVITGGGTHGEVTMAYYHNKPIYLINQLDNIELSGWIMSCATEIFPDFKSMQKRLINIYGEKI